MSVCIGSQFQERCTQVALEWHWQNVGAAPEREAIRAHDAA